MGIRLFRFRLVHLVIAVSLALALGTQSGGIAMSTQSYIAVQADVSTSQAAQYHHISDETADLLSTRCSDSGTLPHCGKLGCGGMHCDNTAVILTSSTSVLRVDTSLGTLPLVLTTRFSAEPPIQPPRF